MIAVGARLLHNGRAGGALREIGLVMSERRVHRRGGAAGRAPAYGDGPVDTA
ncbi:MAG: hypothetical protein NZM40_00215 [Sphingomonadaceae bacterium]|uniref:hypothetical protein n=1 Tax=Thermaurantiacus sp. TaxID=2820283 RepID=UPI00298F2502|nr:hypothetical protein [Thermaurantiacus sp.]MCS6985865.1 hypothetical protein [Sphingomonadaceae bacterium]MDW8413866.1 hypothetical protein [Thermaurantiacus sp.]